MQTLEGQLASNEGSNIKLLDVAESNIVSDMDLKINPLNLALNSQLLERDEKLLNLSRVTTPEALSMDDDHG